jgi:hypothetical protein
MNTQELAELKFLQFRLEEAKHNYLQFLLSKNYKIRIYDSYEDSLVTAIHRDYLEEEKGSNYRDWVKDGSPDWAEIILFKLQPLLESYKPYESEEEINSELAN